MTIQRMKIQRMTIQRMTIQRMTIQRMTIQRMKIEKIQNVFKFEIFRERNEREKWTARRTAVSRPLRPKDFDPARISVL